MLPNESNDRFILMVKNLSDVRMMLNEGTREQLRRTNLIAIKAYCTACLALVTKEDRDLLYLPIMSLNAVNEFCSAKLNEPGFMETDIDEKEFVVTNVVNAETNLCVIAGKYYTSEHKFPYMPSMNAVYKRIVDVCLENSYYFGLEAEVLERR